MKKYLLALVLVCIVVPSVSFASIDANLKYGARGMVVVDLQTFLINKGFLTGQATGNFFSLTQNAVIAFQNSIGLPATGFVGPLTRARINEELSQANASSTSVIIPPSLSSQQATQQPPSVVSWIDLETRYFAEANQKGWTSLTITNDVGDKRYYRLENGMWVRKNTLAEAQQPYQQQPAQPAPIPQTNYSVATFAGLAPQLAFITCDWYSQYGAVLFSKSSNGLLGPVSANGTYFVDTVLGGVKDTAYIGSPLAPGSCTIQFPSGASLYAGGFSTMTVGSYSTMQYSGTSPVSVANINVDFAQIIIPTSNNYLASYARKVNYCLARASIGDSIAVIGWPINSASRTLTGVITGTSGYYDIANIAVPDGMQGSTAVSLTNGCVIGQINSAGQIADIKGLSYVFGW